ncbi:hypothetical protein Salmuc_01785 [Salipiger mucosus DSM 16094]|uniref:Uncharacterized protein n=2 Tax=Salipiger mucosus TaxID=263378 RepID=S9S1C6_9RHOB|nr:hypothetical protein Salmuc_01785 [Salipiger mucosus DSM 16094]
MTPKRAAMPMVAIARRMGVAAITAVVLTGGFVASAKMGAEMADGNSVPVENISTQLQDLADASLTDAERQVACPSVETKTLEAALAPAPAAAPIKSFRPAARTQVPRDPGDQARTEVRPPLP